MAVNLNDPSNLNNQQQAGQPAGVQQQQQQFKPRTSGFTNIQRVLGANQNNKLGQAVNTGVQSIANKTQSQAQNEQDDFASKIGQANDQIKAGQKAQSSLSNLDFTKSDDAANSLSGATDDNTVSAVQSLKSGYNGPQGLKNQDQLQNNAQDLQQTGQNLLSAGGRQAALQRFVNAGPNYTQGKQRLDAMLLGQTGGQDLREARRGAQQTASNVQNLVGQAQQQGQAIGQTYNTLGQDITSKLNTATDQFGKTLTDRSVTQNKANADFVAGLQDRIKNKQLTADDTAFLSNQGIVDKEGNLYNLDTNSGASNGLAGLFNANTSLTASNTANASDLKSRDALARLSGLTTADADKIYNLDESQVGQNMNQINKNDQGLAGYAAQKKAAEDAMKTGQIDTGYRDINSADLTNPWTTSNLSYQQAQELSPLINTFKTIEEGYGKGYDINDWNRAYSNLLQKGQQLGVMRDTGRYTSRYQVDPALDSFNQLNKQYGIGNNLSQLLANRNGMGGDGHGK